MRLEEKIKEKYWDNLIILDACRHDFFKKVYKKYFQGKLKKATSPASNTIEFCKKVFTPRKFKDTIYISSNPFINSSYNIKGFRGNQHFFKVVDVWRNGWKRKIGTVPPEEVNKAYLEMKEKYPNKRFIIHYMQPHQPYITEGGSENWSEIIDRQDGSRIKEKLKILIGGPLKKKIKRKNYWKIQKLLGKEVKHPMYELISAGGIERLREVYKNEIRNVLKEIKNIEGKLEGKTVLTADHGELLGENGDFGHYPKKHLDKLIEVPWFEIKPQRK